MISALDRKQAVELIDEARAAGARLKAACAELGIGMNTYRRWSKGGEDRRPLVDRPVPSNALTPMERALALEWLHARPATPVCRPARSCRPVALGLPATHRAHREAVENHTQASRSN